MTLLRRTVLEDMATVVIEISTTVDGLVAGPDGAGARLFAGDPVALERVGAEHGAEVTHLRYRVVR